MRLILSFLILGIANFSWAVECEDEPSQTADLQRIAEVVSQQVVNFQLEPDGTFDLELAVDFPGELEPYNILKRFLDPETVVSNSNLIKSVRYPRGSKILSGEAAGTEVVSTLSCKSVSCATTKSSCRLLVVNKNESSYTCSPDLTDKQTGELFYSGNTKYSCRKTGNKNTCLFSIQGRPKPYKNFLISRTSQQLAVGGAVETALNILNIALPAAVNKAEVQKSLQSVREEFYPRLTKSLQLTPSKPISVNY